MKRILSILIAFSFSGCFSEPCKIDFKKNAALYEQALKEIQSLNMNSNKLSYKPVHYFSESDNKINPNIFSEIEFIECHEDGTIIFQAPDCNKETALRNVIYILTYSTKGISHIERKRNFIGLKEIKKNWFSGKHIETLAN